MGFLTFLNENTEVKKSITTQTLDESFNANTKINQELLNEQEIKSVFVHYTLRSQIVVKTICIKQAQSL